MKKFIATKMLVGMIRESDQCDHFGSEPLLKTAVGDILPKK